MPEGAPRSCSCSYTSIVYSEIVTEYPEADCTCARVLQTTTCLPQPLPREPDFLRLEKTLVSDSKPFVPNEPQRIYYARSFPKHVGETFACHFQQILRLRNFQKSQAEWFIPRDPSNTPFHSVHFAKTSKQQECQTLMKEEEEVRGLSITTFSNDCLSIYQAMGSSGSESSSSSGEDEADRLVSMWQKVFVLRSESEQSTVPIFDSGDETNCSQLKEEDDLTEWYRELEKMNVFLDSQPSLSTLSSATASSILFSIPVPNFTKFTIRHGAKAIGNALYNRVRQVFSGRDSIKNDKATRLFPNTSSLQNHSLKLNSISPTSSATMKQNDVFRRAGRIDTRLGEGRHSRGMWAAVLLLSSQLSLAVGATEGLQWDHYHNQDQLEDAFRQINGKCLDISVLYSLGQSVEGRELVVMHFSTTPGQHIPLKPEVKYIGGIHGNEPSGRELLIRLADHLCEGYLKKDSEIMTLLNSTSIHLLPAMNPDGFELALNTEPAERKWLTGRTNAMNVDLNRDFPDLDGVYFELDSMKVPKFDHLLDLFRDDQPRQPETLAVGNWILSLPWVVSANLHEGDLVANYPFDASSKEGVSQYSASPDDTTFKWLAQTYAKNHAHMGLNDHPPCDGTKEDAFSRNGGITNGAKWYSVVGGMQDFNYLATNAMEITLELSCEKMVDGKQLPQFWQDNKKALMAYMFTAHAGVKGQIFDAETGLPVQHAALWVRNGSLTEPIRHPVTSWEDGDYYRVLPPGQYELLVDAEGYETASQNVTVTNQARDQALIVNFGLKPIKVPNLEGEGPSDEELAEILSEMRQ